VEVIALSTDSRCLVFARLTWRTLGLTSGQVRGQLTGSIDGTIDMSITAGGPGQSTGPCLLADESMSRLIGMTMTRHVGFTT